MPLGETVRTAIGEILRAFTAQECANYFHKVPGQIVAKSAREQGAKSGNRL